MSKSIYVIFSSTPYWIGKAIRIITGETYNHVSIALDPELTQMYRFARRYYKTPFYGGFVKESLSRYHINGKSATVKICQIPVSEDQYKRISSRMNKMLEKRHVYLYNHISILGTVIKKPIRAKGAYTCAEFCVMILNKVGIDLDPKHYYTISALEDKLRQYAIYTGTMPQGDHFDSEFYAEHPVPHPTLKTIQDIAKLVPRIESQKK